MVESLSNKYNIKVKSLKDVIKTFLTLTKPSHGMTDSLILVTTELVNRHILLSAKVADKDLVNELLFSTKIKKEIQAILELKPTQFNNMMTMLRKRGVITAEGLKPSIIPNVVSDTTQYELTFKLIVDGKDKG
jgi:hypothetical protein